MLYRVTYLKKISMLVNAETPVEARRQVCPWYQYPPREDPDMILISVVPAAVREPPKTWPGNPSPSGGGPQSAWPVAEEVLEVRKAA